MKNPDLDDAGRRQQADALRNAGYQQEAEHVLAGNVEFDQAWIAAGCPKDW